VANRIGGAQAVIADRLRQFEANDKGGSCLHSGSAGTHLQVWRLTDTTADSATLRIDLADGAGGFPGNRSLTARFSLCAPATLRLELGAQTDAPTIFNATSHSYWNLDGTTRWAGHTLQVLADHWLPTDAHARPTGEVALCDGSPLDFRQPIRITPENPALDHCFCLSAQRRALQKALVLTGASGVSMTVATTEPGVQIYDNRGPYAGLAIETQGWPDAPSHPHFPAITLQPGVSLHQITEWRFEHE
jgi:aldose 1-epimerase